jgi:hypothetical protein
VDKGIERTLGHAEYRRHQCGRAECGEAEPAHVVIFDALSRNRPGNNVGKAHHPMVRNKHRLVDAHGFAAGTLQTTGKPGVLIHDHVGDRHEAPHHVRRALGILQKRAEHDPLAVLAIACVRPAAGKLDAARHDLAFFAWIVGPGDEIVGIAPDVTLSFKRKE